MTPDRLPRARLGLCCLALAALAAASFAAAAQSISGLGDLPRDQRIEPLTEEHEGRAATDWRTGTYGPVTVEHPDADAARPFGADLFKGGFRGTRASGLNATYRILPGDQITVRAWGALDLNRVLPVDAQGNIFIPSVGPVQVMGVSNSELDSRVRAAIRQVFTDNVSVYTNLQGVQPVAVFVTGFVESPGRYAGTPDDSLLYFLDQASGIAPQSGSFRDIRILRDGDIVTEIDLYGFLLSGHLPRTQFEDGDTIVVGRRGPAVTVSGDVATPYRYELVHDAVPGADLLELVQLKPGVSHALLTGTRNGAPISAYLPLNELHADQLHDGDELLFAIDTRRDTIIVQLEGSFEGPSRFTVPNDAALRDLLDSIPVNPSLADVQSVSIRRESVAERQRRSLEDSLRRLETAYLGASSSTVEEARIRAGEAELIQDFVRRARQTEPSGRMVIAHNGRISDIRLQDGDVITIPERSHSLLVSGEVLVPQAMVYQDGQRAEDYIRRAGGFTERADKRRILVVRPNGEVVPARGNELRPGDEILVLPAVPTKNLQLASTLAQILFQIAVTTRVVLDI
jgi:protein involved in polysaccharide export with SLBB domain